MGAIIVALAGWIYAGFWPEARALWSVWHHDRNGHFNFALELALALRAGDISRFIAVLATSTVWGPLHGLILAPLLAVAGPDHRLGVLPSLAGWIVTVAGAGMLARLLAPTRATGIAAAALAVGFALASAAHRAFAVDVMLESLGAALTIVALVLYVRATRAPADPLRWRALAIALTALFFEKYNYWALVIAALGVAAFWDHRGAVIALARSVDCRGMVARWLRDQPRRWDNYALLLLLAVIAAILVRGPTAITIGGREISLYPPGNLVTLAYAWVLLRAALAVWRARAALRKLLPRSVEIVAVWHLWPAALSLAIPRRIGPLLWYLGPANSGDAPVNSPINAFVMYAHVARADYLAGTVGAVLLVIGISGWILCRRRLRPGANAVLILFVLAAIAVVIHPNQKPRFLHSWIAVAWVIAGVGLATAAATWARGRLRHAALAGVVAVALGAQTPHVAALWTAPPFMPSGPTSDLDLTDAFDDAVTRGERVAVIGTLPFYALASWTTLSRVGEASRFERVVWWRVHDPGEFSREFAAWLAGTRASDVVVMDMPRNSWRSRGFEDLAPALMTLPRLMASQSRFDRAATRMIDGVEITLWRRAR